MWRDRFWQNRVKYRGESAFEDLFDFSHGDASLANGAWRDLVFERGVSKEMLFIK
jgi:hypothetical protein